MLIKSVRLIILPEAKRMAKPIQYVVELSPDEAERFLAHWLAKAPNPARDATIARAQKLKLELR